MATHLDHPVVDCLYLVLAAEAIAELETMEAYAGFQHNHPGPISGATSHCQ